jgi:hypothetical protein
VRGGVVLKAHGSRILTVAVGVGGQQPVVADSHHRRVAPDVIGGSGTFDIATGDVYRVSDLAGESACASFGRAGEPAFTASRTWPYPLGVTSARHTAKEAS